MSFGLHGVREAARKDSQLRFTALLHHVNEDCLRNAFFNLKKTAAVGVDGVTWHDYEQDLPGFSYAPKREHCRPGRRQHDALDALSVAITSKRVNWILDADVEGLSIPPKDVLCRRTCYGDLWIEWWRKQRHGDVVIIRYADDFVIGFERLDDAEACLKDLQLRFARFGLKLHESKTRLIESGKYATERRDRRREGRPETFDFPGFTHKCARTRKTGWFTIHRHSIAKRMRATFQKIKTDLQRRRHRRLGET